MKWGIKQENFLLLMGGTFLLISSFVFIPIPEFGKLSLLVIVFCGAYLAYLFFLRVKWNGQGPVVSDLPSEPVLLAAPETEPQGLPDSRGVEVPSDLPADSLASEAPLSELKSGLVEAGTPLSGLIDSWDNHHASPPILELKANSDFIYENIIRAYDISDNLANTAKQAFELSEHVQKGVGIVTGALSESLKNTDILFEQSQKITSILEIMSDVSEKIHILSINASIVSARAGLQGKGFEVVAKEIRNLAKETENSLKDIENTITELQGTIGNVIGKVQDAHTETENEKNSLISVAGSLQGVILAVEIIRAVSSMAKEKSEEQNQFLDGLISSENSKTLNFSTDREVLAQTREALTALEKKLESLIPPSTALEKE